MPRERALTITISGEAGAGKTSTIVWLTALFERLNPNIKISITDDDYYADDGHERMSIAHAASSVAGISKVHLMSRHTVRNERSIITSWDPAESVTLKAPPQPMTTTLDAARQRFTKE